MSNTDTPPVGETQSAQPPVTAQAAPPVVANASDGEVERLKLELEKKTLRENQLANQLKAKEEAEEKSRAAELEKQNEFKTLFEQEKAKREALETEREREEAEKALDTAKQEVLGDYSDEVKTLAKDLGLELADASETSKAALKEKLEKLNTQHQATGGQRPNNPGTPSAKPELTVDQIRGAANNDAAFDELIKDKFPGIAAMRSEK